VFFGWLIMSALSTEHWPEHILNFAHRGARKQAPENTLPAFRLAADLGADGVELDVHLSADGVPMVIHNARVDETTNGSGMVKEKTLAELRELDAGCRFSDRFAGTPIPTLSEVLAEIGAQLLVNIELKAGNNSSQLVQKAVELVRRHNMAHRVMFSSFDVLLLRCSQQLAPGIPVGYLYFSPILPLRVRGWLASSLIGRCEAFHPRFSLVNEHYVAWAHRHHYHVNVWTVNEIDDIERMCALGVDMIMSDYPDRVRDALPGG
jgi:glycerophosphoryl diester phosphodiesterase